MQLTVRHIAPLAVGVFLAFTAGFCDSPTKFNLPGPPRRADCWKHVPLQPGLGVQFIDATPQVSHDETKLAFFSWFDSCNDFNPEIYVLEEGFDQKRPIGISGPVFRWLPGDTEMIVNRGGVGGGELVHFNLNTKEMVPLNIQTRLPPFDISPDGRFVYYEGEYSGTDTPAVIRQFDRETGENKLLGFGVHPAVSHSGSFLAYDDGSNFMRVLSLRGSAEILLPRAARLAWLLGDSAIVSTNSLGMINVISLDGTRSQLFGEANVLLGAFGLLDVSPISGRIYFEKVGYDTAFHIWSIDPEGGDLRQETW